MPKLWLGPVFAIIVAAKLIFFLPSINLFLGESLPKSTTSPAWASVEIPLERPDAAIERFSGVLKFRTISSKTKENHVVYPEDFRGLHKYLRKQWPLVFQKLQVTTVHDFSLLFKWQGSDPNVKPLLFISHQDVVAVGSESAWTYPPFSGKVADGFIWGRGALDLKFTAAALLEAVSIHLSKGHVPRRTIYLAFGHDEEVGGGYGAAAMAETLEKQGIEFEHVFDEGGSILVDGIKGILDSPLGLVGTAEKATQNMEIEVHGKGGHTMVPPHDGSSVVARMGRLVNKIETSFPAPKLQAPTSDLLKTVGSATPKKLLGLLLRNCEKWPISWLVAQLLARKDPELGSALRTTGITTDIQFLPPGRNVIPSVATAHLSYRLLPYDKPERIHKQLESFAAAESKGGEVKISKLEFVHLSPVSSTDSLGFQLIKRAAMETLKGPEGLVMAPYLMLGRTDSTHYTHLSGGNIFRFMPFTVNRTAGDLQRIHGIDERVGTDTYLDGVRFYIRYLQLVNELS